MEESAEYTWSHELPRRNERRDAAEHRRRILEAAQHLFAAHGVQAVSMHQIAREAGVGQGTLYRRYAHKGDLCMDLLHEVHQRLYKDIDALLTAKAASPALERLDAVLTCMVTFFEQQWPLLQPFAADTSEWLCDASEQKAPPPYLWLYGMLKRLFTEAVERGELGELDIAYTVDALLATLHPMIYRFQRHERGFSQDRILQGLRRIYIDGIKTPREAVHMATRNTASTS
jgi:AcrR family transcriptional regulator